MKRTPLPRRTTPIRSKTRAEKSARTRRLNARNREQRTMAIPVPLRKSLANAIDDTVWQQERDLCCSRVRLRDVWCRCGCHRSLDDVHEEPPRSKGGDATDPECCIGLNRECHDARHFKAGRQRLTVQIGRDGASAAVFFERDGNRWYTLPNGERQHDQLYPL